MKHVKRNVLAGTVILVGLLTCVSTTMAESATDCAVMADERANLDEPIDAAKPDESDYLWLVNRDHPLPVDYVPGDLRKVNISFAVLTDHERAMMRDAAATALETMFADAEAQQLHLLGVSGYRSYQSQCAVYAQGSSSGQTDEYIAKPGYSEHQTGLAMDIGCSSADRLSTDFADTKEGCWVTENAHKYGFIIRYPADAEEITGYKWEPWHLRYVGDAAREISANREVLETYLKVTN